MTVAIEGVQVPEVPMIVDRLRPIMWRVNDVPSLHGVLYTAPDCSPELADQILAIADSRSGAFQNLEIFDTNEVRAVVADGDVVHKISYYGGQDNTRGLSAVRAGVALEEGLRRLPQPADDADPIVGPHYYAAAHFFGAFIPYDPYSPVRQVISMSREPGHEPESHEVPSVLQRRAHLSAAIVQTGMAARYVILDDQNKNMAVERSKEDNRLRIGKFDVLASANYVHIGLF